MTPEDRLIFEQFTLLLPKIEEISRWMQERKQQQITLPLDPASRNVIGAPSILRLGSTAKTQVYTDSRGDTVTGPKAYAKTFIIMQNGQQYEVPSLT